jgi:YgiT-type zinc finger domain-containing protein
MNCGICRQGTTEPGSTTLTLTRGKLTFVVHNVPAQVCQNCGEAYLNEAVTMRLFHEAEQPARAGAQLDVREYAA